MTDRIGRLEELARLRAAGDITDQEFAQRKAEILGFGSGAAEPEPMSDDNVQRIWGSSVGLAGMVLSVALFYFNGWAITKANALYGLGTDLGFFIGPYEGAYALFLRIGDGWTGLARTNIDALLIDAPMLNAIGLVASLVLGIEGFKSFMWPTRHVETASPES